jgi:hypothetical protein
MAHVGFEGLDVQLLARVLFDGRTGFAIKVHFPLQHCGFGAIVAGIGKVLSDVGIGADEGCYGLVKRNAQRFGVGQRLWISGVAAEVVQELLHLTRRRHGVAQVMKRLAGSIELLFPFF